MKINNIRIPNQEVNRVYIFHHDDRDGVLAAAAVMTGLENCFTVETYNNLEFITFPVNYTTDFFELEVDMAKTDSLFFFVDYSFSGESQLRFLEILAYRQKKSVFWIDHHGTSIDIINSNSGFLNKIHVIVHTAACGALLTYLYFESASTEVLESTLDGLKTTHYTEFDSWVKHMLDYNIVSENDETLDADTIELPEGLKYTDLYDRWADRYTEWRDALAYAMGEDFSLNPRDSWCSSALDLFYEPSSEIKRGDIIISNIITTGNSHIERYGFEFTIETCHTDEEENLIIDKSYKCIGLNRSCNSMTFETVKDKYDILVPFYWNPGSGEFTYSFYTYKDIDCSELAVIMGGGGHKKASGFQNKEILFKPSETFRIDTVNKIWGV